MSNYNEYEEILSQHFSGATLEELKNIISKAEKWDEMVKDLNKRYEIPEEYRYQNQYQNFEIKTAKFTRCDMPSMIELIHENEMLKKSAKKYDEICNSSDINLVVEFDELGMTPTILLPNVKECEDKFRNKILALIKENQEHKEHIEYLEGKIKLLEKSVEAFEEENEILKEGVKTMFNDYSFKSVWDSYKEGHSINFHKMSKEDSDKIKSMLEVVDNE